MLAIRIDRPQLWGSWKTLENKPRERVLQRAPNNNTRRKLHFLRNFNNLETCSAICLTDALGMCTCRGCCEAAAAVDSSRRHYKALIARCFSCCNFPFGASAQYTRPVFDFADSNKFFLQTTNQPVRSGVCSGFGVFTISLPQ